MIPFVTIILAIRTYITATKTVISDDDEVVI